MLIQKAFKFRLKPNTQQRIQLAKTAGCVRLVWNKTLDTLQKAHEAGEKYSGYNNICKELVSWKKSEDTDFLKEVHSQPLQQTQKDLDKAFKEFSKKRKGFPKFKKKNRDKGFRYPQGIKVENQKVFLPKIGWVKFQKSRAIEGKIKNATMTFHAGHWYISIQTEFEKDVSEREVSSIEKDIVGIDMGVKNFATTSRGEFVEPLNSFKKHEKKLAKEGRKLSRKKKGSRKWILQKYKLQKCHAKIANVRKDFLHKLSSSISKNHAVVVIEDLKVSNMSRSAKGNSAQHGKSVKAKSGLNKAILDQGWYEFRRQLEYKQRWSGGRVIAIPPQHTSQKCFKCGHVAKENRKTQELFSCVECGASAHADVNAAQNIKAAGHAVLAREDISLIAS